MPKYFVFNPGPNWAVELKPGFGEFRIGPSKKIEVPTKELAQSLVVDSGGHLRLEVVEDTVKAASKVVGTVETKPNVLGNIKPLNSTKPPAENGTSTELPKEDEKDKNDGERKDNQ